MKIAYIAPRKKLRKNLSVEGSIQIMDLLLSHFKGASLNDPDKLDSADIIDIHTSGFLDAIKYRSLLKRSVYSVNSNLEPVMLRAVRDMYDNHRHIFDSTHHLGRIRLVKSIVYIISNMIPVWIKRLFIRRARLVVLPNEYTYRMLGLKNSCVIRQGIDIRRFVRIRKGSGAKEGKRTLERKGWKRVSVAYFGHPASSKGLFEAISAMRMLDAKDYDKRLYLTYKSRKITDFVKAADRTIQVLGRRDDMVGAYNENDIILLPFRHSIASIANPLVLLEAMACERAVVTSDLAYLREIGGDSLVYAKANDPKSFAEKIEGLRDPEKRKRLGKLARQRVVRRYDAGEMLEAYENIYKRLLKPVHRR